MTVSRTLEPRLPRPGVSRVTDVLGVRFDPAQLDRLRLAAEAEDRTVSGLVRRIVADWLRRQSAASE